MESQDSSNGKESVVESYDRVFTLQSSITKKECCSE